MSDTSLLILLSRLLKRTRENKIDWEPVRNSDEFRANFGDYAVTIAKRPDPEYPEQPDYALTILDSESRPVEEVTNLSLAEIAEERDPNDPHPYTAMAELYERARRTALGADKAIRSILEDLL